MTRKEHLIEGPVGGALPIALASSLSLIPLAAIGEDDTEVTKVTLSVRDWSGTKPTAGILYRTYADRRTHVAEVGEDGKVDRAVKCKRADKFEAQAESALDRPIAPVQLTCNGTLAFQFTRMFATTYPADYSLPIVADGAKTMVFATYADVFASVGKMGAASVWTEASLLAAASSLGDAKYDQFVYRDASVGFKLKFTEAGIAALKAQQKQLGIPETGELDEATKFALAKRAPSTPGVAADWPRLRCMSGKGGTYACEPYKGGNLTANNTPSTVFLPKIEF